MESGAIDCETGHYIHPLRAEKGRSYKCPDCDKKVIFRKGNIRKHHFAHFHQSNCQYFEHPNESQKHKDAKLKLAERLKQRFKINISNSCPKCTACPTIFDDYELEYIEGSTVIVEYRDPKGKYIADIALLKDSKVVVIFEIKYTHATITNVRPEPWFEVAAEDILENEERILKNDPNDERNEYQDTDKYYLECLRNSPNRYCINCKIETESWAQNIPSLVQKNGMEKGWTQDKPCIICKRKVYSPQFIQGPKQVCKICISTDYEKLKELYDRPLFID